MINLRQLEVDSGSVEGARSLFQKLILHLVKLKHKTAQDVRPCPGDWGIDVLVGQLTSGTCLIWQVKYFMDGIDDGQKTQIKDSFKQLIEKAQKEKFKVDVWYLCVPCVLSNKEIKWWETWGAEKTAETNIPIKLIALADIEQILMTPEAEGIRTQFNLGNHQVGVRTTVERAIKEMPDGKASQYENSLFIRKLVLAGITENMSARSQFFNAELVQKEIHDKGDLEELKELTGLYEKIHSMWETRFNEALLSQNPEMETKKVYAEMLKSIEQTDKGILSSPKILATFFHKQGFMQQLANICKVGWTPDYRSLDTQS
jgi:hypothetical protein